MRDATSSRSGGGSVSACPHPSPARLFPRRRSCRAVGGPRAAGCRSPFFICLAPIEPVGCSNAVPAAIALASRDPVRSPADSGRGHAVRYPEKVRRSPPDAISTPLDKTSQAVRGMGIYCSVSDISGRTCLASQILLAKASSETPKTKTAIKARIVHCFILTISHPPHNKGLPAEVEKLNGLYL